MPVELRLHTGVPREFDGIGPTPTGPDAPKPIASEFCKASDSPESKGCQGRARHAN